MKNTIKELTEGMQRLCAVANRIVAQDGKVSRIETDLLMEDLRRLYDVAMRLNGDVPPMSEPTPVEEAEPEPHPDERMMAMMSTLAALGPQTTEVEPEKDAVKQGRQQPEPQPEPEPAPQPTMEEIEQTENALLFDEIILDSEPAPESAPEPEPEPIPEPEIKPEPTPEPELVPEPEPEPQPESKPHPQQASLLDYLTQPSSRTLGETLGESHPLQNSLERKVDDLRTVININDKFSFMSELFRGNMKAYNDFIMHLNALASRDEALAHVQEVAAQYKWEEASPTVQTFYKIFDKKF